MWNIYAAKNQTVMTSASQGKMRRKQYQQTIPYANNYHL
jgi:hypothetical protein